jgi:lysophospholipase L1-like esterase
MLSQDARTAFTGGQVPVVGTDAVNTVNVANKAITPKKTTFIDVASNQNLFDKSKVTSGYFVQSSNGQLAVLAGYNASDYIEIKPGTAYITAYSSERAYYDANKVFISGQNVQSFTTPSNAKYVRFSISNTNLASSMLVEGTVLPSSYVPYSEVNTLSSSILVVKNNLPSGKYVGVKNAEFITVQTGINLFNPSTWKTGYFIDGATGGEVGNSAYGVSDFIPITAGKTYSISYTSPSGKAFYDINKQFLAGNTLVAPTGAAYIRISTATPLTGTEMLVEGSTLPAYTPYTETNILSGVKLDYSNVLNNPTGVSTKWTNQPWVAIGDSITEWAYPDENGVDQRWTDLVSSNLGTVLKRCAEHSMKMSDITAIMAYSATTEQDLINAKLITVSLGQNDYNTPLGTINDSPSSDGTSFYGSTKGLVEYLLGLNSKCSLAFITPTPSSGRETALRNISTAIKDVCALYSIPPLDLNRMSNFNSHNYSYFYTDSVVHPNGIGYKRMADITTAFLKTL